MKRLRPLLLACPLLLTTIGAYAVQVSLTVRPARCGLNNGKVETVVSGGLPPYTYAWSTGATGDYITGLGPGSYTVTVTDGQGESVEATGEVEAVWALDPNAMGTDRPDCDYMCSGMVPFNEPKGTAPYTSSYPSFYYDGPGDNYLITNLCAGQPTSFTITDANGCSGAYTITVDNWDMGYQSGFEALPACGGGNNGTIIVPAMMASGNKVVVSAMFPGGTNMDTITTDWADLHVNGLAPGNYQVSVLYPIGELGEYMMPYCDSPGVVTVDSIPGPCGTLSGSMFNDMDQNCMQDAGDIGLPYRVLTVQPGDVHAFTSLTGTFAVNLPFGSFTLEQPLEQEAQICPLEYPVAFTLDTLTPSTMIHLADLSNVPHDVSISLAGSALRPGFPFTTYATVANNTAFPSGALTVGMDLDPVLGTVSPAPAAALNDNGHVEWELPAMQPYSFTQVRIFGTVPPDVGLLGSDHVFAATVVNGISELNTANNTATRTVTVTGSYDPNDIQGFTSSNGSSTSYFLDSDTSIDYTVHFQNTGTDTAFTVAVHDEIDTTLDPNSIEFLGASHTFVPSFGEGREMVLTFPDILLPDSTTDLVGSQGFVSYRIRPRNGVQVGDVISNTAAIYFDFNEPVITNTVTHVVEIGTGIAAHAERSLRLAPNPAGDVLLVMGVDAKGAFDVLAADGRKVAVPVVRAGSTLQLDVHALAPGVYMLRTANGTARFVKE